MSSASMPALFLKPRQSTISSCATRPFWPAVGRVDNVYGDRNLVCSCVGMEAYAEAQ